MKDWPHKNGEQKTGCNKTIKEETPSANLNKYLADNSTCAARLTT